MIQVYKRLQDSVYLCRAQPSLPVTLVVKIEARFDQQAWEQKCLEQM